MRVRSILTSSRANIARNFVAGLLAGYGFVSFLFAMVLRGTWIKLAPTQPNPALGLLYTHNEHGAYAYFSAFQATTCGLLFATSIPLAIVGGLIAPKKNITGIAKMFGASFNWDQDDPGSIMKWTAVCTAIATPFILIYLGPYVVGYLNDMGIVFNPG